MIRTRKDELWRNVLGGEHVLLIRARIIVISAIKVDQSELALHMNEVVWLDVAVDHPGEVMERVDAAKNCEGHIALIRSVHVGAGVYAREERMPISRFQHQHMPVFRFLGFEGLWLRPVLLRRFELKGTLELGRGNGYSVLSVL